MSFSATHARNASVPVAMPAPRELDLLFCSDAEYRTQTLARSRTTSSPAPTTPTKLIKQRPFSHVKDSVALRKRPTPAQAAEYNAWSESNFVSFSPRFSQSSDDLSLPSESPSRRSCKAPKIPRRRIVNWWKGLTNARRKPNPRESVFGTTQFEFVTPRRA
ncbi:hypothetical protein AURDEDRAFT_117157 [Auricularia subglabra TFB-10046 SS5]|nr:hypothetical protein AURDEDRAFT_117157 [Auricularia subglabra TFB-10046 SS5]